MRMWLLTFAAGSENISDVFSSSGCMHVSAVSLSVAQVLARDMPRSFGTLYWWATYARILDSVGQF